MLPGDARLAPTRLPIATGGNTHHVAGYATLPRRWHVQPLISVFRFRVQYYILRCVSDMPAESNALQR